MTATRKAEVFAAYGDDADDALRNWAQIDPEGYQHFVDTAAARQYVTDYRAWSRRQRIVVERTARAADAGAPPLFDAPAPKPQPINTRATVVHDGTERHLLELAGAEGAALLRQAALRDLAPAESTTQRCRFHLELADLIEAATVEAGRPVAVSEVLHLATAVGQ